MTSVNLKVPSGEMETVLGAEVGFDLLGVCVGGCYWQGISLCLFSSFFFFFLFFPIRGTGDRKR